MELRSLFGHLVPRLDSLDLAADPQTAKTTFVGGHKSVPIRYVLNAAPTSRPGSSSSQPTPNARSGHNR
jgi:hypothetical protein